MSPRRVLRVLVLGGCFAVLFLPSALAGTQSNAKIALHARAHSGKNICSDPAVLSLPCSGLVTGVPSGAAYDVYVVVAGADPGPGIAGLSFGIDYDPVVHRGVDGVAWTRCSDLQFPNTGPYGAWPAAGAGMRVTWNTEGNCQNRLIPGFESEGAHALVGCMYVFAYGPDSIRVTHNDNLQSGPELVVADCSADTTHLPLTAQGSLRVFSGPSIPGCNPCLEPCPGELPSECLVSADTLDFGILHAGEFRDLEFTYRNIGQGYVFGQPRLPHYEDVFSIVSGGEAFVLGPGESRRVVVRSSPPWELNQVWYSRVTLSTGRCPGVLLIAGMPPPPSSICITNPDSLDFGTVNLGESVDRSFLLLNRSYSLLSGTATPSCEHYVVLGNPDFNLQYDEYRTISVRYRPQAEGQHDCVLELSEHCVPIVLHGRTPPFPVPVKLLSFTAERDGPAALLRWRVDTSDGMLPGFRVFRADPGGQETPVEGAAQRDGDRFTLTDRAAPATRAAYWLLATDRTGSETRFGPADLPAYGEGAGRLALSVFPSPFTSGTVVEFALPEGGPVQVSVFDTRGRRIRALLGEERAAGQHRVAWDGLDESGRRSAPGIYLVEIRASGMERRQRIVRLP